MVMWSPNILMMFNGRTKELKYFITRTVHKSTLVPNKSKTSLSRSTVNKHPNLFEFLPSLWRRREFRDIFIKEVLDSNLKYHFFLVKLHCYTYYCYIKLVLIWSQLMQNKCNITWYVWRNVSINSEICKRACEFVFRFCSSHPGYTAGNPKVASQCSP